jgi:hypothetical protein
MASVTGATLGFPLLLKTNWKSTPIWSEHHGRSVSEQEYPGGRLVFMAAPSVFVPCVFAPCVFGSKTHAIFGMDAILSAAACAIVGGFTGSIVTLRTTAFSLLA